MKVVKPGTDRDVPRGVVGGSETRGTAYGSDGTRYSFDCDMRFMRGVYVGLDGRLHGGSFGFI